MVAVDWETILPPWLGDALPLGVIITDNALSIRYWSPWLERHTGMSAKAIVGHSLLDRFPDLERRGLDVCYGRALRGESVTLTQREHGYLLPIPLERGAAGPGLMQQRAVISPLTIEGPVVGTLTTITDLSERATQDRLLEQPIERFMASLGVAMTGPLEYQPTIDGIARAIVPYLADWCVVDIVGEVLGTRFVAVAHADPKKEWLAREIQRRYPPPLGPDGPLGAVLHQGQSVLIPTLGEEQIGARAVDAEHLALIRALSPGTAILVPLIVGGAGIGVISLARATGQPAYTPADLALAEEVARRVAQALEKVRLYAAAERSRAMAEEAVRLRDSFFSVAAHELRTPLTTLLGRSQLLQKWLAEEEGVDPRSLRSIRIIVEQAQRLNGMITALLDVSRIQSGRFSIDATPMDLRALVRRMVDETRLTLRNHTISLHEPAEAVMVAGDEVRLEQVFQNLVSNAVKYSPAGGEVRVEVARRDGEALVTVTDQGIGIPESSRDQLFRRFYRAENAEQLGISGLGIGLFVVNEIIELHDGQISVSSAEDAGSTFEVRLPLLG